MSNFKWIFVDKHETLALEEARDDDLLKAAISPDLRVQYHLIPTELWIEYTDTRNRLQNLRKKISQGPPPKLTVVADIGAATETAREGNGAGVVSSRPTR